MAVKKAVLEKWMVMQKRHRLSDKQVQMARELGLNPDKFRKDRQPQAGTVESTASAVYRAHLFQAVQA